MAKSVKTASGNSTLGYVLRPAAKALSMISVVRPVRSAMLSRLSCAPHAAGPKLTIVSNAAAQCPPADALAAFAYGELAPDRASEVQSHVSQCEGCLETVGYLAGSRSALSGPNGGL